MHKQALAGIVLAIAFQSPSPSSAHDRTHYGERESLGRGHARSFVQLASDGSPRRIGVVFDHRLLHGLPKHPNDYSRCYDVDGDGSFGEHECIGDYEVVLMLPDEVSGRDDLPFTWIGLNWNAHGHIDPAPPKWSVPHFDFHFYIAPLEEVKAIRGGPCGELIDCDDFVRATEPVPAPYLPAHHIDVGAAVPAMGNHLVDTLSPELVYPDIPFTHTWIYGAYDGAITFYEPMITLEFLRTRPNVCTPLHLPESWTESGYYPTEYCIRSGFMHQSVTLEKFVYRTGVSNPE